jgi:hypothetical protein
MARSTPSAELIWPKTFPFAKRSGKLNKHSIYILAAICHFNTIGGHFLSRKMTALRPSLVVLAPVSILPNELKTPSSDHRVFFRRYFVKPIRRLVASKRALSDVTTIAEADAERRNLLPRSGLFQRWYPFTAPTPPQEPRRAPRRGYSFVRSPLPAAAATSVSQRPHPFRKIRCEQTRRTIMR